MPDGVIAFIEEGTAYFSPPVRPVEWHCDLEEAIAEHYYELRDLLLAEHLTIH